VECHATGTPVGDAEELRSLRELRGDAAAPCVIGSVKSNVGHLLTGAGAAGLAKVLLALRRGVLPPTANFRRAAAASALEGGPLRVLARAEPWERRAAGEARRAAVSAFGFGGINAHLLVEEHLPGAPAPVDAPSTPREAGAGPIAVVGMAARLGPWTTLRAFQERVLGGGPGPGVAFSGSCSLREPDRSRRTPPGSRPIPGAPAPAPPTRGFGAALPPGHFVDEVRIPAERFRIPPRELEEMLPQQALMLLAAGEALEDAGARSGAPDPETGVFVGMGLDLNTTNFHLRWTGAGASQPPLTANRTVGALGGMVASRIAREFRFGGPSFAVHAEDASGLRAVEVAVRMLREGRIDRALAGAVDLAGDPRAALGFDALRPFSPDGEARPFDADASGTVPGEGVAAVVLKRLDDARRDGDRIHAVIRGVGASSGGAGAERPPAAAIARALERAWGDAGLEPAAAGYLEAHGSGDPAEDAEEARAIVEVFGNRAGRPPLVVGSAKALVGHAGAASGLAGLVRAALCLRQEVLPALPGTRAPLAGFAEAAERFRLPAEPQAWVRDRADGPRRAAVTALSIDGNCAHAVLEAFEDPRAEFAATDLLRPLGALPEAVFVVEADGLGDVDAGLASLAAFAREATRGAGPEDLARRWLARRAPAPSAAYGAAVVARGAAELADLAGAARRAVRDGTPSAGDRVFWSPEPLGGDLALVFPGSGNHFPGMGRALGLAWPEVLRAQDARTLHLRGQLAPEVFWDAASREDLERDPRALIFGQVALKTLVADALAGIGVRPRAAIGYSLGETAALFSLGAWRDRDGLWRRMRDSTLFTRDLAGPCRAARRAWGLGPDEPVEWTVGVVDREADEVRRALRGRRRAYLLVVNAPGECVVGGSRLEVESLVRDLGAAFHAVGGVTTVHCEVAGEVEEAYRDLHLQETHPVAGVRFYSGARGGAFEPDRESAADAITAQALDTLDFARVVEAAWSDGARFFLETGPGASCTRMIGRILEGRPFAARAVAVPHRDETGSMLRAAAHLVAERLPVDLAALHGRVPPPPDSAPTGRTIVLRTGGDPTFAPSGATVGKPPPAPVGVTATRSVGASEVRTASAVAVLDPPAPAAAFEAISRATVAAHERWLAFADAVQRTIARAAGAEGLRLPASAAGAGRAAGLAIAPHESEGATVRPATAGTPVPVPFMDRAGCLEFARGSIGKVLGPEWAEVDAHPTRVRLPDGPLLLCHRVLRVEGTPRSLGAGRVVTAHDVLPDAWYLDGGRIPTGVAVEAGQADLFLSAWLGIDFATRGRAVYRLLDAEVAFHGPLPGPGSVIEYDIRIERFFRQGETHLFRFRFDGTVDGRPFLTMRDGCAGFFTPEELAAGRGLVRPALGPPGAADLAPPPWMPPLPAGPSSLDAAGVDALRRGDLAAAFGAPFGALPIARPAALPGGRMALVHRLPLLDPSGGPAGLGLARGETDIRPGDWFLECHFTDDRVMPGTLMYETCLQVLRALLLRRGWVAEAGAAAWEPVPGASSRLRCRGQVTEATRVVSYEVAVRSLSYGPEPRCVADALMLADGKPIVEMTGITVRLSGTDEASLRAAWETALAPRAAPAATIAAAPRPALYGKARILAFSNGSPSEAFGEPYRPFDRDRVIARLPGPPFQFLDRITAVQGEPWTMAPGISCEAQHDVDPAAWYFADARAPRMPFAVLLEVALQPCGWLAAYMGSALASESDLRFRNLGGSGVQHREVGPDAGVLAVRAACTGVSSSGGMIIQHYDFAVHDARGPVYEGTTYFGFFADEALA
ncbi:MAG TPA: beta-ketoacyl synthase N-terminal-like domain-containing protein, partial [Planctomycetota bacterium]|nr:beta-ketoacyl synthase N-terminal-like domain-containing protein [Planctomycetota bacterium]